MGGSSRPLNPRYLADDWMCSETGTVDNITFWVSTYMDGELPPMPVVVEIWSDNRSDYFSKPDEMLWADAFEYEIGYNVSGPEFGMQSWMVPPMAFYPDNHITYYRIDITNISDPFIQENGTMYWLVIWIPILQDDYLVGWKTSLDHFEDHAVWGYMGMEGFEWYPLNESVPYIEPFSLAFVISGEPLEYGDPTEFPDHKMHYPQYPDPYGWDVDWVSPDWQGLNLVLADDWMCTKSGNVTDVHFWLSTYGDEYDYNDIWAALVSDNFIFAFMSDNPGPPYSHPENVLAVYYDGYDINLSGPYYGDQGWLIPDYDHEEHNHNQFWRVDITNFTYPFYQEFGTIYWLGIGCWNLYTDPYVFGWKTTDYNFNDNAVYGAVGEWYPLYDPITNESLDFAFVISGEPLPPDVVYVDDDFDISTPGWGYDHFDNIPDAIENVTEGGLVYIYNGTYLNAGAGNLPNPPGHSTNILIQKSLTIQGESPHSVIIDAQGLRNGIMINCSTGPVTIDRVQVINYSARGIGQYMEWQPIYVRNCIVRGTEWATAAGNGIQFSGNYSIIENNTVYGIQHPSSDGTGILAFSASHSIIRNNYVTNNAVAGVGIGVVSYYYSAPTYVWNLYAINNTVENNILLNFSSYGILVMGWVSNSTINNNDISNCTIGISIENISFGGYLKEPSNIIVHSNLIYDNPLGISLNVNGNLIVNNLFNNLNNAYDNSIGNIWNISKTLGTNIIGGLYLGGNYWSDYPGEDTNNDSIGDTFLPYNNSIYVGGDYLPLTPMANQPPDIPVLLSPANNTDYGTVYARYFNCSIYDADNDSLIVYFYWGNDTLFGTIHNATNGNVSLDRMFAGIWWLQHDTTYYWYVIVDDSLLQNQSETWSYHTTKAWDINEDKKVNALDVSTLVTNYGATCLPGELPADVNNDGKIDALDVSSLVTHYGEEY
jgi:hypothetical protein